MVPFSLACEACKSRYEGSLFVFVQVLSCSTDLGSLFLPLQLLRPIVGDAHFVDGMDLSFQKVDMAFFVQNHALE